MAMYAASSTYLFQSNEKYMTQEINEGSRYIPDHTPKSRKSKGLNERQRKRRIKAKQAKKARRKGR